MPMTKKYFLTCKFLCALFLINLQAQDVFKKADSLFSAEKYHDSALEYERIIYLTDNIQISNLAHIKKSYCYKLSLNFNQAYQEMLKINYSEVKDSNLFNFRYETALCAYLSSNFTEAENQFLQMQNLLTDSSQIKKFLLLRTLNYNELQQWDMAYTNAQKLFDFYLSDKTQKDSLKSSLASYFSEGHVPKLRKENLASILSRVPGLGQIYAGYWGEGLIAFGINLSCLSFGVCQFCNHYYITGYMVGAGLLSKFYFGNLSRTSYLVKKRNYLKTRAFNDSIKSFIFKNLPLENH
ncbi:MAG: hypothetical protein Q8905_01960 [Bacteroidota bacterium]|nr:hypothetical protein [Bacteroidota bacterium]